MWLQECLKQPKWSYSIHCISAEQQRHILDWGGLGTTHLAGKVLIYMLCGRNRHDRHRNMKRWPESWSHNEESATQSGKNGSYQITPSWSGGFKCHLFFHCHICSPALKFICLSVYLKRICEQDSFNAQEVLSLLETWESKCGKSCDEVCPLMLQNCVLFMEELGKRIQETQHQHTLADGISSPER